MNSLVNFPNRPEAHFTFDELARANGGWGCNCGPAALAAMTGIQLYLAGQSLHGFMEKGFTNPTMMAQALMDLEICFRLEKFAGRERLSVREISSLRRGLIRIQFDGPWCRPEVPKAAAYKHTHWIGAMFYGGVYHIFDVNADSLWETAEQWEAKTVCELMAEEKRCTGWFVTHRYELEVGR